MGGVSEIMADCGWSWMVGVKLWLVVGGGDKIMAGRGWSWVVARVSNAQKKPYHEDANSGLRNIRVLLQCV